LRQGLYFGGLSAEGWFDGYNLAVIDKYLLGEFEGKDYLDYFYSQSQCFS
jgi:hypothetical protein